ncbi:hypothetical protein EVB41_088 [Rhizobium phage RHph_TM3_14A]|nr:hypothetical protein EVB29_089 [Rhizobium phage RHph_TM27A]QIG67009.1 hypothetical protein EVB30_089 [Rhizobium phage RHph_TM27B]QIG67097.1 hypothetical protein EVB31_087 [Rhizobium phage RHph_TM29]QIG67553.1 hypothetical protein EVB41_088 [Rhizobium phage RHph_TM3_14A]
MSRVKVTAIDEPNEDPRSLRNSVLQAKEAIEVITGQRGAGPFVTWEDLVRLGIVEQGDVPR